MVAATVVTTNDFFFYKFFSLQLLVFTLCFSDKVSFQIWDQSTSILFYSLSYQEPPFEGDVVSCLQLPVGVLQYMSQSQSQLENWGRGSVERIFHLLLHMDQILCILSKRNIV